MSSVDAQKMLQLLQQDELLRNRVDRESISKEIALQLVEKLGQENNLQFTKDELIDELKAVGIDINDNGGIEPLSGTVGQDGELSEDALEAVAGGYASGGNCSQW